MNVQNVLHNCLYGHCPRLSWWHAMRHELAYLLPYLGVCTVMQGSSRSRWTGSPRRSCHPFNPGPSPPPHTRPPAPTAFTTTMNPTTPTHPHPPTLAPCPPTNCHHGRDPSLPHPTSCADRNTNSIATRRKGPAPPLSCRPGAGVAELPRWTLPER